MAISRIQEYGGVYMHKITHPDHDLRFHDRLEAYTCCGCKEIGVSFGYKCPSCEDFTLHDVCAFPVYHKDHPFDSQVKLRFSPKTKLPHRCDVCDEVVEGFLYKSPKQFLKRFRAHPLCISVPEIHTFSRHGGHEMRLQKQEGKFKCGHCKEERRGWRYLCETTCPVVVGVRCAMTDYYGPVKPCSSRKRDMILKASKWAAPIVVGSTLSGVLGAKLDG